MDHKLSEFEQARAKKLVEELANKLAEYFPEMNTQVEQVAEVRKIFEELKAMGFHVVCTIGVNPETGGGAIEIELLLPKSTSKQTESPQE